MQKGSIIEYPGKRGKVFRIQFRDASGKQIQETVGSEADGFTRDKAEEELADRILKVRKKGYRRPKPILFGEYADRWLEAGQVSNDWSDGTLRAYKLAVRRLNDEFGTMRLSDIRRPHVNEFGPELMKHGGEDGQGLSARSTTLTLTVLHSILQMAVDEELLDSNPAHQARRPRLPDYQPRALTPEETKAVYGAIKDPQVKTAFLTIALLGPRLSELLNLRWRDVSLSESRLRIVVSKTREGERSIAIPDVLKSELESHFQRTYYKDDSNYVFCHPDSGAKWHPRFFRTAIKTALTEVGIQDHFRPAHDLRVTSLTNGVLANENPAKLQARAGHRSFGTTKRYLDLAGQVFPEEAENLAARLLGETKTEA